MLGSLGSSEGPVKEIGTPEMLQLVSLGSNGSPMVSLGVIWLIGLLLLAIGGLWPSEYNAHARSPHAAFLTM